MRVVHLILLLISLDVASSAKCGDVACQECTSSLVNVVILMMTMPSVPVCFL